MNFSFSFELTALVIAAISFIVWLTKISVKQDLMFEKLSDIKERLLKIETNYVTQGEFKDRWDRFLERYEKHREANEKTIEILKNEIHNGK